MAGIALAIGVAALELHRGWRLPALAFAFLAIPGNVDHLLPRMTLDPHDLVDATGPAVSVIDLLVLWAVILTIREQQRRRLSTASRPLLIVAAALILAATVSVALHVAQGVEPAAGVRGVLLFARTGALLLLAGWLVDSIGDAARLALGAAAGGVALLANGIYTTVGTNQERFTAATFGRNDFAIALILVATVCVGLILRRRGELPTRGRDRILLLIGVVMAGATLFGAAATGTRVSLIALGLAIVIALAVNRTWRSRAGVAMVVAVGVYMVVVIGTASILTTAGGRTATIFTDPGLTVNAITDGHGPDQAAEVRTRRDFWDLALRMIKESPLIGVGPYQWNVQRYVLDPTSPVVTADTHDSYLQMAAEYGLPTLALYLVLIIVAATSLASAAIHGRGLLTRAWPVTALAAAGAAFLIADVTNSNFFNGRTGSLAWMFIAVAVVLGVTDHRIGIRSPAASESEGIAG